MLAICVIVLVVMTNSVYGEGNPFECYKREDDECDLERLPREFPITASQLREDCDVITEYLECSLTVREECDPNSNRTRHIREFSPFVSSICDEDGPTYKVLSENVQCIASVVDKVGNICQRNPIIGEEGLHQFFHENAPPTVDLDALSIRDLHCLESLVMMTCGNVIAGVLCGDEVENVFTEVTDDFEERMGSCSPEMLVVRRTLRPVIRDAFRAEEKFLESINSLTEPAANEVD